MPITDNEYTFGDNEFLVSKTDRKGRITYCNEAFIKISGFTEDELLGQPHNLVRHPEMPKAAFAEMWNNIQAGCEWHGMVKNRSKDGGFYWVDATVTPSFDSANKIVGYMSVRRKPTREQIDQAQARYQQIKAEEK